MAEIFKLFGSIFVDSSEAEKSITSTGTKAEGLASKLGGGLAKGAKAAGTAIAATGAIVTAAGTAMVANAKKTAEYGDSIDKNSQKLGISAEAYQEWEAVLQHSGTSMDSMGGAFKKLSKAAQDASDDQVEAFNAIGLSMDEVSNMSTEELWARTIEGLQGMEEGAERTALATQLLGSGAQELGALLNTSSEDTQGMIDQVHELGGVMSNDAVKNAAAFQDALQDMQTSFSGVTNEVGAALLPILTDLMNWVTEHMPEIRQTCSEVFEKLQGGIEDVANWIENDGEEAFAILEGLFNGLVSVIGSLWDSGVEIFNALKEAWTECTDSVSTDGVSMEDVFTAIQTVIEDVTNAVVIAIGLLGDTINFLVEQAQEDGTLINTVWENIQTAVDTAFKAVTDIINVFKDLLNGDFSQAFTDIKQLATDVWDGIWEIIQNDVDYIWGKIEEVFGKVYDAISEPFQKAHDTVSDIVGKIKGLFDFNWSLPELKLPHIIYDTIEVPVLGTIPDPTTLHVDWYDKAYKNPYLLDGATIFGAMGGNLLGGGEGNGAEMIYGRDALMSDISEASGGREVVGMLRQMMEVFEEYFPQMAQSRTLYSADDMASNLQDANNRLARMGAW